MNLISPIKLDGIWSEGYAMDKYVISSQYKGDDPFGNPIFDNQYSEIGKLLHDMKYNGHTDTSVQILSMITPFMDKFLSNKIVDAILPIPPTNHRDIQPVFIIAEAIAEHYNLPFSSDVLVKTSTVQSKNMPKENKTLSGCIVMTKAAKRHCSIMLVDDLYSTGSTAHECTKILKKDKFVDAVYYIAISKTKSE